VQTSDDFDKSVSLNLWCEPPKEFAEKTYDYGTEVYFLGKLFQALIDENEIGDFQYGAVLGKMCQRDPRTRPKSFGEVEKEMQSAKFIDIEFSPEELDAYRVFADAVCKHITKIENGAKYRDDFELMQQEMEGIYRTVMLEEFAPNAAPILRCFLSGTYYYKKPRFPVSALQGFLSLLKSATLEQKRIVFANLQTRFGNIARYSPADDTPEDDIPF
jgi:hypothetical protein